MRVADDDVLDRRRIEAELFQAADDLLLRVIREQRVDQDDSLAGRQRPGIVDLRSDEIEVIEDFRRLGVPGVASGRGAGRDISQLETTIGRDAQTGQSAGEVESGGGSGRDQMGVDRVRGILCKRACSAQDRKNSRAILHCRPFSKTSRSYSIPDRTNMKARYGTFAALGIAIGFICLPDLAAQTLDIYVIDVEGGNAVLFVSPTHESLIDGHRQCRRRGRPSRCGPDRGRNERRGSEANRSPDHDPLARRPFRRHGRTGIAGSHRRVHRSRPERPAGRSRRRVSPEHLPASSTPTPNTP